MMANILFFGIKLLQRKRGHKAENHSILNLKFIIMKNLLLFLSMIIILFGCQKKQDTFSGIPDIPTATAATNISNTGFTANWLLSENATDYEVDVATDNGFTNIISMKKMVSGPVNIEGPSCNIKYYYRVRAAVNGSNLSSSSNVISVFTLPDPPVATPATHIHAHEFQVNWNWSAGITSYLLYVSTETFPSSAQNILPNYNGITVTSNTHKVIGLNSATKYYYVLKARNGNYISEMSNVISCTTTN